MMDSEVHEVAAEAPMVLGGARMPGQQRKDLRGAVYHILKRVLDPQGWFGILEAPLESV